MDGSHHTIHEGMVDFITIPVYARYLLSQYHKLFLSHETSKALNRGCLLVHWKMLSATQIKAWGWVCIADTRSEKKHQQMLSYAKA